MTLDWFHFCEYSFQTSTGKPGVIGIHDVIIVNDFPAAIPFGFVFQIRTVPNSKVHVVMNLKGPGGARNSLSWKATKSLTTMAARYSSCLSL